MKALLSRRCGGPETLVMADVPEPEPAAGQVRIAVRACGIKTVPVSRRGNHSQLPRL